MLSLTRRSAFALRRFSTATPPAPSSHTAFPFLPVNALAAKPGRNKGITEIHCYVSTGGYVGRVLAASAGDKDVLTGYLRECKDLGYDVLDLSWPEDQARSGHPPDTCLAIDGVPEVTRLSKELESAGSRDPKWLIDSRKHLSPGRRMIMIESEEITENVRSWRTDVISAINAALPNDRVIFEAADPEVFAYHIQNQGAHTNLFVDHSQNVQLARLRRGIWGTGSTFGRIVTFQT
ncbi:hypothetical protein BC827DRAFT_1259767 [Russula dissimulans]|nr:hypothetical protein BC827DRAFT_1259767 [Russula dissimulans]